MGRGDKRTFKGKIFKGSFGKTRPRHQKDAKASGAGTGTGTAATASAAAQTRKK
jgi:ribosomal small subunit protein bTHX